ILQKLKSLGVKIAIDDFGTGYSSFGYLSRFAVDVIKIDRSFVAGLGGSDRAVALASSMVDLARALSLDAVAEGIEQAEQLTVLSDMGCKFGQGFFMAVPQNPRAIERFFEELLVADVHADTHTGPGMDTGPATTVAGGPAQVSLARGSEQDRSTTEVVHGAGAMEGLGAALDDLHASTQLPIMARSRWLTSWAEAHNTWEPLGIVVRDRTSARIDAAALLAQRFRPDGLEVVGLGHGSSCTRLPGRDERATRALAEAIGDVLESIPSRWRMELEQLPQGDPVALALQARLTHAHLLPDLRIPRVTFSSRLTSDGYLSRNMRKQIRRAYAHLQAKEIHVEIDFEREINAIAALLPQLVDAHLERDHRTRRSSDLDDPAAKTFWYRVLCAHNEVGKVEIATLRLNGELAAYVVGLVDDRSWRVFDGHMVSRFSVYSPGRLLEAAVVDRVVADESFAELDWMTGVAAEKLLCSTGSEDRMRLVAFSEVDAGCALCRAEQSGSTTDSTSSQRPG
ncbi:MAG: GNAT family N-acetyltransferase, partial [Actinobacteria bacterium]|nr:GNAT family N-acetyltransferase [Actinomycetota bacterium]